MIVSTNQPYFMPFPGFFYKAHLSDVFVILDTVQFPRGSSWVSRNRFKNDQGVLWLCVPVWRKGLGLQRIHEVKICHEVHWVAKHLASLKTAYARAPYLADHLPFVENTYQARFETLLELNMAFIRYLFRQLGIQTEIKLLSQAPVVSLLNLFQKIQVFLQLFPGWKSCSVNPLQHLVLFITAPVCTGH